MYLVILCLFINIRRSIVVLRRIQKGKTLVTLSKNASKISAIPDISGNANLRF